MYVVLVAAICSKLFKTLVYSRSLVELVCLLFVWIAFKMFFFNWTVVTKPCFDVVSQNIVWGGAGECSELWDSYVASKN